MSMSNAQEVNAAEYLAGMLRAIGFEKSEAEQIVALHTKALEQGQASGPHDYNPELYHAMGYDHGAQLDGYTNITAMVDPYDEQPDG